MDVWSVGCIFAELLLRKPLFPGSDAHHQLELIINILGTPIEDDISSIPHGHSREKIMRIAKKVKKPLSMVIRNANPLGLDLLEKMLAFNPEKRISIAEALEHPYLTSLHKLEDEPIITNVSSFDFKYEYEDQDIESLKYLIYQEILLYHFPEKVEEYERAKSQFNE